MNLYHKKYEPVKAIQWNPGVKVSNLPTGWYVEEQKSPITQQVFLRVEKNGMKDYAEPGDYVVVTDKRVDVYSASLFENEFELVN